jgi:DNA-directed RNA polymerase subunit RPC12/RpoP
MSVLESLKSAVGMHETAHAYECRECGHTFESNQDPDSYWLSCTECGSEELTHQSPS